MLGGGVWPIVQRELRAAARWPLGHWLRVGGALGGLTAFCVSAELPADQMGVDLFERLHVLLLGLMCAIVPALTADGLARERREGTLGLLFMTPLTASGIVLGKSLAQMLRALTVWLAVMPVLTIPFLIGGVTWADVLSFLVIELCVGFLCLAAGVLASSLTDNRAIAFIFAFLLMGAFVGSSNHYEGWVTPKSLPAPFWRRPASRMVIVLPGGGFLARPATPGFFFQPLPPVTVRAMTPRAVPLSLGHPLDATLVEDFTFAFIVLLGALRFAGWRVERSWQDKIPSVRRQNWLKRYCTPVFKRWFAGHMRRTLEWNPIAWLQQYSWKARLSKWGLCLLFVLLECPFIDGLHPDALSSLLTALLLILAVTYTYAGVNGFLQEKKSGALELILVSPLSVNQIIFGRVWGLWKQFLPSVVLLLASDIAVHLMIPLEYVYFRSGLLGVNDQIWLWAKEVEIVAIYLTLPVIATACALRFKNLFLATALTWATLLYPAFAGFLMLPAPAAFVAIVAGNIFSAGFALSLLRESLARRTYAC